MDRSTRFESIAPRTGVRELVVFHRAEFDRPDHPKVLNPDTWGIPPGVKVISLWNSPQTGKRETGHYIGGGVHISPEEWETVKIQYDQEALRGFWNRNAEIGRGHYPKWWTLHDGSFGLSNIERQPDLWEAFVRRWILRHSVYPGMPSRAVEPLSKEQISAAWAILKDSRRRAEPILRRIQSEIETIPTRPTAPDAESTASSASQASDDKLVQAEAKSETAVGKGREKLSRHERELEEIFELMKDRLIRLLREKQKLDDEERDSKKLP